MTAVEHDLGQTIEARRKELGLSPTALADAAGVTLQGLAPLRAGKIRAYQERLTVGVCRALRWTPDSIDRLMRGEPPVNLPEDGPDSDLAAFAAEMRAQMQAIDERVTAMHNRMQALEHPARPPARQERPSRK